MLNKYAVRLSLIAQRAVVSHLCLLIPPYVKKLYKPKYALKIVYLSKYDSTLIK